MNERVSEQASMSDCPPEQIWTSARLTMSTHNEIWHVAHLEHLQQQGREGDELAHCFPQTQQGPNAAQAQWEVPGCRHKAHAAQQHLCQGVHQGPQLLQAQMGAIA